MGILSKFFGKVKSQGKNAVGEMWNFKEAKQEQEDLALANEVSLDNLVEMNVYRIFPMQEQKIGDEDMITANGTIICSVCEKEYPVDFKVGFRGFLNFYSKHSVECPHCSSITRIVGVKTEVKKGEEKFWILAHRETGPPGVSGSLPQIKIETLSLGK
ncbi:MAG: hypothetical protein ACETWK_10585 [Candidatus Aminicenantaceae bacterium]